MNVIAPVRTDNANASSAPSGLPALVPIGTEELPHLARLLDRFDRADGYLLSPSYYAMTGRKGLWLYGDDRSFMMVAAHPNKQNHLLLFPPFGDRSTALLKHATEDDRFKAHSMQLARFSAEDNFLLEWAQAAGGFKVEAETALDWALPIHTYSTGRIREHEGREFRNLRHGLHNADRESLRAIPIIDEGGHGIIANLTASWARSQTGSNYTEDDLAGPALTVLEMLRRGDLPLHAHVITKDSKPVGYHIWEETSPSKALANSLCMVALDGKGAPEFSYWAMSKALSDRGFDFVCDGGSETIGLDAFKRKMNPVRSIQVQSAFPK